MIQPISAIKIFCCYAPEDDALQAELEKHLAPLCLIRHITTLFDRDIPAGAVWEQEIEARLDAANIILILVSANFFANNYCCTVEMQRALEKHRTNKAAVIPIILRPVIWQDTPISELSVLPTGKKAVTVWNNQDEAWEDVVQGIRRVVRERLPTHILSVQEIELLYPERLNQPEPPLDVLPSPLSPRITRILPPEQLDQPRPLPIRPQSPRTAVLPPRPVVFTSLRLPIRFKGLRLPSIVVLILLALILFSSGSELIVMLRRQGNIYFPTQTATVVRYATQTAIMQNTAVARGKTNTTVSASQTAITQATASAKATSDETANMAQNMYNNIMQGTSGTLALNDPLRDNSQKHGWDQGSQFCFFTNGVYHVSEPNQNEVKFCHAAGTNFTNILYRVQMTIIKGDCGVIIFRLSNYRFGKSGNGYSTSVCQGKTFGGDYDFERFRSDNNNSILVSGTSKVVNHDIGQTNMLAVLVLNNIFYLFINDKYIDTCSDSTYNQGQIALAAWNVDIPTEVTFSNAKVWTLS